MKSAAVEAAYKPMSFIQHATTPFFPHSSAMLWERLFRTGLIEALDY